MSNTWQYQLRIGASTELAAALRGDPACTAHEPLRNILHRHNASLQCQFDAFADYVSEAQRLGPDKYPLYRWTKETIENPEKKAKYLRSFTVHVDGEALYPAEIADLLHAELSALVDDVDIKSVARYDTNPANNPQPPRRQE